MTVLCIFLLACGKLSCDSFTLFRNSCEETSNHSKNDRRQSTTGVPRCLSTNYFGNSGRSIVTLFLRALLRPPYRRRQADGARSTPAPICGAPGDLPVGPQQNEFEIVRSVAMCWEINLSLRARKPGDVCCLILLLHVFDILCRQPHRSSDRWFRYFMSGLGLLMLFLRLNAQWKAVTCVSLLANNAKFFYTAASFDHIQERHLKRWRHRRTIDTCSISRHTTASDRL